MSHLLKLFVGAHMQVGRGDGSIALYHTDSTEPIRTFSNFAQVFSVYVCIAACLCMHTLTHSLSLSLSLSLARSLSRSLALSLSLALALSPSLFSQEVTHIPPVMRERESERERERLAAYASKALFRLY